VLHDASSHASLSLAEVVALSSNVGVSRIFDALGEARFLASARRFHVGEAPPAIAGAAAGALPASLPTNSFEGGAVAAGEGALLASPAQIAAAYATIAAGGVYHAPNRTGASPGERVVSPEAAEATLALLDGAVNDAHATGSAARVDGVRVAGKTGTSDLSRDGVPHVYASFVGIAPREAPRLVVLVGADLTGARAEDAYGGKIAAPVFSRIIRRALAK
jgi:cell division protein FtsI (penicillin-binding protein 3)